MQIIDNQKDFDATCKNLLDQKVIYMDTEFHRKRTYYAKLSIIQIASGSDQIIIDVLSGIDISGLKTIIANENIVKVFHAPGQDFDIFLHLFGELPKNVFDTQTAAGVVGLDDIMGYGRLCKELLHINLDKTMQKANWLTRPLRKELLDYAIKDVEYLVPLYRELSKTMTDRKLWDTFKARSQKLIDAKNYKPRPEKIMKKMNLYGKSENFQNRLLQFIQLREECAQQLDIPRGFCADDNDLIQLCELLPTTDKALYRLSIASQPIAKNKFKDKVLNLCAALQ
ncbi:MAG: ribonuclease D [Rickettsiaceae bacterium]|nr:ribonuclease D [Rickettsiaceae bacterium]